ncbi:hypothetical protein AMECASPLE_031400 [Ameca splendens]|uniref:Uncharacterized protein n=1 Tax=Ameca splendens TaxID=208324 RepID=A0ABV0Z458_9TELE
MVDVIQRGQRVTDDLLGCFPHPAMSSSASYSKLEHFPLTYSRQLLRSLKADVSGRAPKMDARMQTGTQKQPVLPFLKSKLGFNYKWATFEHWAQI